PSENFLHNPAVYFLLRTSLLKAKTSFADGSALFLSNPASVNAIFIVLPSLYLNMIEWFFSSYVPDPGASAGLRQSMYSWYSTLIAPLSVNFPSGVNTSVGTVPFHS